MVCVGLVTVREGINYAICKGSRLAFPDEGLLRWEAMVIDFGLLPFISLKLVIL